MTKRISILLAFILAAITAHATQYQEEFFNNIKVDTVWLEGNNMGLYVQKAHIKLTNISDEPITATLYVIENNGLPTFVGDEKKESYIFCSEFTFTAAAGETAEVVSNYVPWRTDPHVSTLYIGGIAENSSQMFHELYRMEVDADATGIPSCDFTIDIEGTDGEGTVGTMSYQILRQNKLTVNWSYTNLEDYYLYNGISYDLYECQESNKTLRLTKALASQVYFNDIAAGETKTGTMEYPQELEEGHYYILRHLYGFYYPQPPLWHFTTFAQQDIAFRVQTTLTDITDISADAESLPVYTIGGVRVADAHNLQKGIYVRGGKKFVVK